MAHVRPHDVMMRWHHMGMSGMQAAHDFVSGMGLCMRWRGTWSRKFMVQKCVNDRVAECNNHGSIGPSDYMSHLCSEPRA
jgi:hypothetical protein